MNATKCSAFVGASVVKDLSAENKSSKDSTLKRQGGRDIIHLHLLLDFSTASLRTEDQETDTFAENSVACHIASSIITRTAYQ